MAQKLDVRNTLTQENIEDNIVFGIGSFSYQYNTRDTFGFAMKSTWAQINGEGVNLIKDPITDDGVKKSATGRVAVLRNNDGKLYLYDSAPEEVREISLLRPVWVNGTLLKHYTLTEIRDTIRQGKLF